MEIRPIQLPVQAQKAKARKTYEALKVINPPKTGTLTPENRSTKEIDEKGKQIDLLA